VPVCHVEQEERKGGKGLIPLRIEEGMKKKLLNFSYLMGGSSLVSFNNTSYRKRGKADGKQQLFDNFKPWVRKGIQRIGGN